MLWQTKPLQGIALTCWKGTWQGSLTRLKQMNASLETHQSQALSANTPHHSQATFVFRKRWWRCCKKSCSFLEKHYLKMCKDHSFMETRILKRTSKPPAARMRRSCSNHAVILWFNDFLIFNNDQWGEFSMSPGTHGFIMTPCPHLPFHGHHLAKPRGWPWMVAHLANTSQPGNN